MLNTVQNIYQSLHSLGKELTQKQKGYLENYCNISSNLESIRFYQPSENELYLIGNENVISSINDFGDEFSIDNCDVYLKIGENVLLSTTNRHAIADFEYKVISKETDEDFDQDGILIED